MFFAFERSLGHPLHPFVFVQGFFSFGSFFSSTIENKSLFFLIFFDSPLLDDEIKFQPETFNMVKPSLT